MRPHPSPDQDSSIPWYIIAICLGMAVAAFSQGHFDLGLICILLAFICFMIQLSQL